MQTELASGDLRGTTNKLSFESPENLLDYLFMIIKDFEEKNYMKYPVADYKYFGLFKKDISEKDISEKDIIINNTTSDTI